MVSDVNLHPYTLAFTDQLKFDVTADIQVDVEYMEPDEWLVFPLSREATTGVPAAVSAAYRGKAAQVDIRLTLG